MTLADPFFGTSGPRDANIVIVGESWGSEEAISERPFVGQSGQEFRRMLVEASINPDDCFMTNVIPARPPGNETWRFFDVARGREAASAVRGLHPHTFARVALENLHEQITTVRPKLIIAAGNYALWALTNCTKYSTKQDAPGVRCPSGIASWRGSMWYADAMPGDMGTTPLRPVIHPAAILREWYLRAITVHDLKVRVPKGLRGDWRPHPQPVLLAPPTFDTAKARLDGWLSALDREPMRLVCDIETARGLMTCIGFSDSIHFAMTIPWINLDPKLGFTSYWTFEQENELATRIRRVLTHRNILLEGQNFLYDTQYIQQQLGCTPRLDFDTMLAQHLLFPGTPKGLDYLSSLYCEYHWYWKEDGKEWDTKGDLGAHLRYNGLDCIRQYECGTVLRELIPRMGQTEQWEEQKRIGRLALRMMNKGVRIDKTKRAMLALELAAASSDIGDWLLKIIPQDEVNPGAKTPWFRSPTQCREFFGEDLGLRLPNNRKTGQLTFGKEALNILRERHPELTRLFDGIKDYRSVEVFHRTFIDAALDHDGRMRCSFNPGGTETFRWSSSTNVFGSGTNLQNIPSGNEED